MTKPSLTAMITISMASTPASSNVVTKTKEWLTAPFLPRSWPGGAAGAWRGSGQGPEDPGAAPAPAASVRRPVLLGDPHPAHFAAPDGWARVDRHRRGSRRSGRVESAVELVPDQVAQHPAADPAIRRTTGTGGSNYAKQPRLAADQPLQGGRGGWQLPTETHWRSQPGGAWGGYRAARRQSGSDVQPVGT